MVTHLETFAARMAHEGMNKRSEASSLIFSNVKEKGEDPSCECECGAGCSESLSHFAFTMEMDDGEGMGGTGEPLFHLPRDD
jgi:hypothetical protein